MESNIKSVNITLGKLMDIAADYQKLEEFTADWLAGYQAGGGKIFCRKGCAGCCNLAVHATFPESAHVAQNLSAGQTTKLQRYIDKLKGSVKELSGLKSYLKVHRQRLGPCPFLQEQGTCSIYNQRPLSCRALLSTRPAAWCTVDFSTLNEWDKTAYLSSLDKAIVAWPTHFVAATQDFARELEVEILQKMQERLGWNLSGNFPLLVWLSLQCQRDLSSADADELRQILADHELGSELLTTFNSETSPER